MTDLTFSPERAARGEPVQEISGFKWFDTHYVGLDREGSPVIQAEGGLARIVAERMLRMKPMPTKKWVLEFDTKAAAEWALHQLRRAQAHDPRFEPPVLPDIVIKEVEIQPENV